MKQRSKKEDILILKLIKSCEICQSGLNQGLDQSPQNGRHSIGHSVGNVIHTGVSVSLSTAPSPWHWMNDLVPVT